MGMYVHVLFLSLAWTDCLQNPSSPPRALSPSSNTTQHNRTIPHPSTHSPDADPLTTHPDPLHMKPIHMISYNINPLPSPSHPIAPARTKGVCPSIPTASTTQHNTTQQNILTPPPTYVRPRYSHHAPPPRESIIESLLPCLLISQVPMPSFSEAEAGMEVPCRGVVCCAVVDLHVALNSKGMFNPRVRED